MQPPQEIFEKRKQNIHVNGMLDAPQRVAIGISMAERCLSLLLRCRLTGRAIWS